MNCGILCYKVSRPRAASLRQFAEYAEMLYYSIMDVSVARVDVRLLHLLGGAGVQNIHTNKSQEKQPTAAVDVRFSSPESGNNARSRFSLYFCL